MGPLELEPFWLRNDNVYAWNTPRPKYSKVCGWMRGTAKEKELSHGPMNGTMQSPVAY